MDGVKLSEIKGLMMSYRERGLYVNPDSPCYDDAIAQDACMFTANLIIAEQGSRSIGLDREKLKQLLNKLPIVYTMAGINSEPVKTILDAIIANEKEIIVFKGTK